MHTIDEPPEKCAITAVCTVTDPAERQRRLAQVYGLILDFGRRKRAEAKAAPADAAPAAN
jgi:hypothetical protein